jgi:hypothetical protein
MVCCVRCGCGCSDMFASPLTICEISSRASACGAKSDGDARLPVAGVATGACKLGWYRKKKRNRSRPAAWSGRAQPPAAKDLAVGLDSAASRSPLNASKSITCASPLQRVARRRQVVGRRGRVGLASLLRHPSLAQAGEIGSFEQGDDLRHPHHPRDFRRAMLAKPPSSSANSRRCRPRLLCSDAGSLVGGREIAAAGGALVLVDRALVLSRR